MMTGTAAATFPISSSVCMIFLIRACRRKGTELGCRGLRPCRRAGGSQGVPREKGREAQGQWGMEGGGASGREHLKAPAPPQQDLGPSLPGVQPAEAQLGHVLTGGNRALYFFFLLGISGPLSPSRAQRRRPQPPGSGPVRRRPAAVSPGSCCRLLRPRRCPQGPSAASRQAAPQTLALCFRSLRGGARPSQRSPATPTRPQGRSTNVSSAPRRPAPPRNLALAPPLSAALPFPWSPRPQSAGSASGPAL